MKRGMRFLVALGLLSLPTIIFAAAANFAYVAEFKGGLQKNVIYPLDKPMLVQCGSATSPSSFSDCVTQAMKTKGASDQALAFYRYANGFVKTYKTYGPVQVVYANMLGADYSDGYFFVNKAGQLINIDDFTIMKQLDISSMPGYASLKQIFPQAMLWSKNHNPPKVNDTPSGGQEFIYQYQIKNGCNACNLIGTADVAFYFTKTGAYAGVKLLGLNENQ